MAWREGEGVQDAGGTAALLLSSRVLASYPLLLPIPCMESIVQIYQKQYLSFRSAGALQ